MDLAANFVSVRQRIKQACQRSNRDPGTVTLLAVTKGQPPEAVRAALDLGQVLFGENKIQEAKAKIPLCPGNTRWHMIGHLQTNKAKYAVKLFDLIHSVDSLKLARELDKQAQKNDKIQAILIQVNVAQEISKSGVSVEDATELVRAIGQLSNLAIKGLMTIPPYFNAPEKVKPYFKALRQLRDRIRREDIPHASMDELSMGMTGDFEVAIQEGATLVRIGTAIFGERY